MADSARSTAQFRTMPRQGMRKWAVITEIDGHLSTIAEFHSYPQARAESDRLNAGEPDGFADGRVKIRA